jgi:hypothetical protein
MLCGRRETLRGLRVVGTKREKKEFWTSQIYGTIQIPALWLAKDNTPSHKALLTVTIIFLSHFIMAKAGPVPGEHCMIMFHKILPASRSYRSLVLDLQMGWLLLKLQTKFLYNLTTYFLNCIFLSKF